MKKIVIIPDSFKGSLSAIDVCNICHNQINTIFPEWKTMLFPVADGGEGTVDCFLNSVDGGEKKYATTTDAFGNNIKTYYAIFENPIKTAIIEMASCCGLPQAEKHGVLNPSITTTFGFGTLIKDAINNGCKKIILGLGGSSTNDLGCGLANSLGVKFFNGKDNFCPTGNTLSQITKIDISEAKKNLEGIEIIAMCDVKNPLYGENGAAFVYGPQKGADKNMVQLLDKNLEHGANIILRDLNIDVQKIEGAGAAGGCGAGIAAFLGGHLQSGIETVLDVIGFDKLLQNEKPDIIISGEGKVDSQSFQGKVIGTIAKHVKEFSSCNTKFIVLCGKLGELPKDYQSMGIDAIYEITPPNMPLADAFKTAGENLAHTISAYIKNLET